MEDYYFGLINGVPYKMHCSIEMQFAAYFYTAVPYQALFRLSVYKNSSVLKYGAMSGHFAKIRDFGSLTICKNQQIRLQTRSVKTKDMVRSLKDRQKRFSFYPCSEMIDTDYVLISFFVYTSVDSVAHKPSSV